MNAIWTEQRNDDIIESRVPSHDESRVLLMIFFGVRISDRGASLHDDDITLAEYHKRPNDNYTLLPPPNRDIIDIRTMRRFALIAGLLILCSDTANAFMSLMTPITSDQPRRAVPHVPFTHRRVLRHMATQSRISRQMVESSSLSSDTYDPDLMGVFVDGFPLPPTPVRPDDDALLAQIRQVPITPIDSPLPPSTDKISSTRPLRVIIAGGGLGGLACASTLIQNGVDVHVFEQARTYKPFGGPIQIQSNALKALRDIHAPLYEAVEKCGVHTGDRLSGIKDGIRYKEGWLVKFDAATPALKRDLPLTLAINRVVLQEIFLKYGIPRERVHTSSRVMSYENMSNGQRVAVTLENGTTVYGDILVGADGIWSQVRHQMMHLPMDEVGPQYATKHAKYSGYTCFTGTAKHTPDDIKDVAYKVFLGQEQYLGCTDSGHGWQHWWAFLPDPPGASTDEKEEPMLDRLKREFQDWSPEIHDLFDATKPEVVKQRDIFDRPPMTTGWTDGCVTLMGDACHPTMPNLGQGGAMAIEDAYVLGEELKGIASTSEIPDRLKAYEKRRYVRASIAQFLSRNGSDLLDGWERLRTTPIIGPIAMWCVNVVQPITMNYLYSANF